jgi:hypothetical protein
MSDLFEIRVLKKENAALKRAATALDGGEVAVATIAENARLRVLLDDVHTGMIAAGWGDDQLLARVKKEIAP